MATVVIDLRAVRERSRYPSNGLWTWPFTKDHPTDDVRVQTQNGQIVAAEVTIHHNWLSREVIAWAAERTALRGGRE